MKLLLILGLVLMLACGVVSAAFTNIAGTATAQQLASGPGGPAAFDCTYQQVGCVLAVMAQTLEDHVWGRRLNSYDPGDLAIHKAYQQWLADCGGTVCSDMAPGNLQCVKFVEGVFALANDPLPFHHNALLFWSDYANLSGWSEIKSSYYSVGERGWPAPGDMVIWADEDASGQVDWSQAGHIAVAVNVTIPDPKHGIAGQLVVAQGNGPGNTPGLSGQPGDLYHMQLNPDKSVVTWGGFMIIGYIRQNVPPTGMPQLNLNDPNVQAYLPPLLADASAIGLPGGYYAGQIQAESGFNPNAVSPAGAEGIAQFLPSTAAGWNPPFDPFDPLASLKAGAQYDWNALNQFGGDYAAALSAYNAGSGAVQACIKQRGITWLNCMPSETQRYVNTILGW